MTEGLLELTLAIRGLEQHQNDVDGEVFARKLMAFLREIRQADKEDFWPLNTALYVCDFKESEPRFVDHLLRNVDFTIYSDKGAVPGINRNHLHKHAVVSVPRHVQRAFVETLAPVWERQRANRPEGETLAALRNLLLSKLMSGEVRVRDIERFVEQAV